MKKLSMLVLVLVMSLVLFACHEETTTTTTYAPLDCEYGYHQEQDACVKDEDLSTLGQILGLEDITVPVGHYFDVFEGVQVLSSEMEDITYLLSVRGNVQYGVEGTYGLSYTLIYQNETYSMNRAVTVADVADTPSTQTRPSVTSGTVSLGEGSYVTGTDTSIAHPTTPTYLEKDLLVDAIPSSSWWTSLLVQNWGGSNGIYTNPLRLAFASGGMEITDPGDGFVQFWNVNNVQTIAQFPIALRDGYLMSSSLSSSYTTQVLSYGDSHVKVALRNPSSTIDEMVVTMAQGSPYVFVETAHPNLTYTFDTAGVDNYRYYDLEGNQVTDTFTGEALIVEMVHRHSGYECTPPANIGAAQYEDKYYLINTPANTVFTISSYNHPFGLDNRVSIALGDRNTLSIASIQDLSEAAYYHEHGYNFIDMTHISYEIDAVASNVTTTYHYSFREVPGGSYGVMVLMPHQYKYADVELTDYSYRTVRGTLKVLEGDTFQTVLNFRGLLPGFTLPTDDSFSSEDAVGYLNNLNTSMSLTDMDGYINAEGPYWNSKAIYPLAQAIIISRQLGETTLESDFISKMEYVLLDWLSVSGPADEKYLYYDNTWGSVYYSNNDFNTASELSDHSFTHGYLVYAAAVLAMADPNFVTQYGDMVDFLLNDYLYPERGNAQFAYLRNFDPWAGHSWAHGFGTFAEGNNLESSSEALNSWNAGYLWAMVTGDTARMEAAIYGYV
ncbi:MAG: glycosyl hydrolase, partial [Candidatus Izemoplasmatales bacterium]|nr:glycosyl hydrolase [Candidatus Izemoplasmatales bacterium]